MRYHTEHEEAYRRETINNNIPIVSICLIGARGYSDSDVDSVTADGPDSGADPDEDAGPPSDGGI